LGQLEIKQSPDRVATGHVWAF